MPNTTPANLPECIYTWANEKNIGRDEYLRRSNMIKLYEVAPDLLKLLEGLTFIAETVAHMRGLERDILPTTDKARELIAYVKG